MLPCPYVGLRPFRESDYPFFFGRDREIRVIASNLQAQPLTVLYGPSGVGKSSVLQAGVMPRLRATGSNSVVYFNEWQSPSFLGELSEKIRQAAAPTAAEDHRRLDDALEKAGRFFLLLDQFEEFLLYHPEGAGREFDATLARIVNREDVSAKVLIGIREDALSKLDQRFSMRIPNLLGNTLVIEHLDAAAARDAIQRPLAVFNQKYPEAGGYQIEPELVAEILRQVQAGQVNASESTGLGSAAPATDHRIETAFLQLVLIRLWNEETRAGSRTLRLETLSKIGGAGSIVQRHVEVVMSQFQRDLERNIAAGMFRYLVTPSRTKIAQSTLDLVSFAEAPAADVKAVLSILSDRPEARILRRLANPERYEIFHDVLAQPILDWRREYLMQKERVAAEEQRAAEAEQQRKELEQAQALAISEQRRAKVEARAAQRLRWIFAAVVALLLATGVAIYAFRKAREARESATIEAIQHKQAAAEATAARLQAEARRAEVEVARAEAQGKGSEADRLRAQAAELAAQARTANQQVASQKDQLSAAVAGKDQDYRDALRQIDDLKQRLSASEQQRQQLQNQLDTIRKTPNAAQAQSHGVDEPTDTRINTAPKPAPSVAPPPAAQVPDRVKLNNDSAVRVPNTGITLLLKHMGWAPISADLYVLTGGPLIFPMYSQDRKTGDKNVAKFKSVLQSCDGGHADFSGYTVWCFHVEESKISRKKGKTQPLGEVKADGRSFHLEAVDFSHQTNFVEVYVRPQK